MYCVKASALVFIRSEVRYKIIKAKRVVSWIAFTFFAAGLQTLLNIVVLSAHLPEVTKVEGEEDHVGHQLRHNIGCYIEYRHLEVALAEESVSLNIICLLRFYMQERINDCIAGYVN